MTLRKKTKFSDRKSLPKPRQGKLKNTPPQPQADNDYPLLSPKEKEVVQLLLKEMTEKQVAQALDRSPNTIHIHIRNIYYKLGINRRKMLLRIATDHPERLGLDSLEDG